MKTNGNVNLVTIGGYVLALGVTVVSSFVVRGYHAPEVQTDLRLQAITERVVAVEEANARVLDLRVSEATELAVVTARLGSLTTAVEKLEGKVDRLLSRPLR